MLRGALDVVATDLPKALVDRVTSFVAHQRTLEQVVRGGLALKPPRMVVEVVPQDEYTQDVIMPFGDVFIVYDAT